MTRPNDVQSSINFPAFEDDGMIGQITQFGATQIEAKPIANLETNPDSFHQRIFISDETWCKNDYLLINHDCHHHHHHP